MKGKDYSRLQEQHAQRPCEGQGQDILRDLKEGWCSWNLQKEENRGHDELEKSGGGRSSRLCRPCQGLWVLQWEKGKLLKILSGEHNIITFKFHKHHAVCSVENRLEGSQSGFGRISRRPGKRCCQSTWVVMLEIKRRLKTQ